jgi:hypothetical protein
MRAPPGGGKAEEGHLLFDRGFDAAHKALAHHAAHAAAHEVKFKAGRHQADAVTAPPMTMSASVSPVFSRASFRRSGYLRLSLNLSASTGSTSWPIS